MAAGAYAVYLPHGPLRASRPSPKCWPALGWRANQLGLHSAYQTSTGRLGGQAATHPVQPTGKTVEARGLLGAGGTAFPAGSTSNPKLTVMALGHYTAQ